MSLIFLNLDPIKFFNPYFVIDNLQHHCDGSFGCTFQVFFLQKQSYLLTILNLLELKNTVYP